MDTTSPNSPVAASQPPTVSTVTRDPLIAEIVAMLRAKGVPACFGDEIPKMFQQRGRAK